MEPKMTNKQMFRGSLTLLAGVALCAVSSSFLAAQQSRLRVLQTNFAGDSVNIIDPATNKVGGEIRGMEAGHGIAVAPDGSRIYMSQEGLKRLIVIDGKTLQVTKEIPLSGGANLVDITPDGRWIFVAISNEWDDLSAFPQIKAQPNGGVDVIDTVSLEKVKSIALKGGVHDLNVTPDGKYVIAGSSRGGKPPSDMMDVIDTKSNEIAWSLLMSPAPSPMAIAKNPDGSTKTIYGQLGDLNGFAVVDFATQAKINEIKLPEIPADKRVT